MAFEDANLSVEDGEYELALASMTNNVTTLFAVPLIILAIGGGLLYFTRNDGRSPGKRDSE